MEILERLVEPTFSVAAAGFFRGLADVEVAGQRAVETACRHWKLSKEETAGVLFCLDHEEAILAARRIPWPKLQRLLVRERISELLGYCRAVAQVVDGSSADVEYCHERLAAPPAQLDPAPLITGEDLRQLGIPPGPIYKRLLRETRDAQLMQTVETRDEALHWVEQLWKTLD